MRHAPKGHFHDWSAEAGDNYTTDNGWTIFPNSGRRARLDQQALGRSNYNKALLLRLDALQFLSSIAVWIATFYIAILGSELGLSNFDIGIIATVYGISLLLSNYIFGSLSDVYGARPFLILGLLFSSVLFYWRSMCAASTTLVERSIPSLMTSISSWGVLATGKRN